MRVKESLKRLDVRPSKSRGQNFLIDQNISRQIFSLGQIDKDSNVIEIGPGLGALTQSIYDVKPHTVIEIESSFCRELSAKFPGLKIIEKDVREVDFKEFGKNQIVYGNLPYSFSTEIIFHIIEYKEYIKKAVFLLQKEFADRLGASPGGKDYGVLSVNVQQWADIDLFDEVSGNSFHPPTKVTSRMLTLTLRSIPRVSQLEEAWFKKVVKASFLQRRKKIANSLKAASIFQRKDSMELIQKAFLACEIDPNRRAETLSIEEFGVLSLELAKFR